MAIDTGTAAIVASALLLAKEPLNKLLGRTWVCCYGIGEYGSSGAAYYLSHNWRIIQKTVGNKPFAYLTRTEIGKDDSTCVVGGPFYDSGSVDEFAKKRETQEN